MGIVPRVGALHPQREQKKQISQVPVKFLVMEVSIVKEGFGMKMNGKRM